MRSEAKKRPPRTVAWLIAVSMVLTIASQVILLNTQTHTSTTASWVILILSSLILAYAIQLLVKKDSTSRDQQGNHH
ncbi:MAG: hypothetical protein L0K41_09460 [Yaniella sp.]|uniref:hypothetical protein n=1 Tax=Yaniella sp. TaxID=2773929 RepID=UPI00264A38EC|nr:hypothetical protein [Yaniella sp.]MDN5731132.1 hypothetical protein [Yaniella sp.]MDN5817877.1 hypothetical protein [Yaniella sp.]MDN5911218.1 hypothetical protein [Yaniella sp.]MDN6148690.1 hypothetical protein [Yaniella sp.]MDN6150981.1 hypothetical protein [Yaniella sp.]